MQKFIDRSVRSVLDKVCAWETDKAVSTVHRVTKSGQHTFFVTTGIQSRYVVWVKAADRVQRREYRRNRINNTTTLFVEYYALSPVLPTYDALVDDNSPAWV